MQDYNRTLELTTAAENASGAAQTQYEKTLDSLETKLTQLKNAWDEFTMSILNNEVIKTGVDILRELLTVVNEITSAFGDSGGLVAKLALGIGAFNLAKPFAANFIKNLTDQLTIGGQTAGQGLLKGIKSTFTKDNFHNFFRPGEFSDKIQDALTPKAITPGISGISLEDFNKNTKVTGVDLGKFFQNTFTKDELSEYKVTDIINKLADSHSINKGQGITEAQWEKLNKMLESKGIQFGISENGKDEAGNTVYAGAEVLPVNIDDAAIQTQMANIQQSFTAAAGAASMLGMAIGALATIGEKFNLADEVVNTIKDVSGALTILAGILMVLPTIVKTLAAESTVAINSIPIIGWITTIITLIGMGIKIASEWIETDEEKLERLEEEEARVTEAAQATREAYESLIDTLDGLDEAYNTLEDMTEGTSEWKDQVQEINDEILTLIENYSQLGEFVKLENGVLTLDTESLDYQKTLDSIAADTYAQSMASIYATIATKEQEYQNNKVDIESDIEDYASDLVQWENDVLDISKFEGAFDQTVAKIQSGEIVTDDSIKLFIKSNLQDAGLTLHNESSLNQDAIDNIYKELIEALKEEANAHKDFANEIEVQELALKSYTLQLMESQNASDKQLQMAQNFNFDDIYDKALEQTKVEKYSDLATEEKKSAYKAYFKNVYGDTVDVDEKGNVTYTEEGATESKTLKVDEALEEYNRANAGKLVSDTYSDITKKIIEQGGTLAEAALEAEGGKLTQADLNNIDWWNGIQNEDGTYSTGINAVWESLTEDEQALVGGYTAFTEYLAEQFIDLPQAVFSDLKNRLQAKLDAKYTDEISEFVTDYIADKTAAEVSGLEEALVNAATFGNLDNFVKQIEIVEEAINTAGLDADAEKLALATFIQTDFRSTEAIDTMTESLEDMGVTLERDVIKDIKKFSGALSNLSFDDAIESIKNLEDAADQAQSNLDEGTASYTNDQYEAMESAGVDMKDFVRTGADEWVYIGKSQVDLLDDISATTSAILEQINGDLDTKVQYGKAVEGLINSSLDENAITDILSNESMTTEQKDAIKSAFGGIVSNIDTYTETMLLELLREGYNDYSNLSDYQAEQVENKQQAATMNYYNQITSGQDFNNIDEIENLEAYEAALDAVIASYEGMDLEVEKCEEKLKDFYGEETDVTLAAKRMAVQNKLTAKSIDSFNEATHDAFEELENFDEGTQGYDEQIGKIATAAQQVWGSDLTEDFVRDNLDLFERVAAGGEDGAEAFTEIGQKFGSNISEGLKDKYPEMADTIDRLTSYFDGSEITIGVNANIDNLINNLIAAGVAIEDIATMVEGLGYTFSYKYIGTQKIKVGADTNGKIEYQEVPLYEWGTIKKNAGGSNNYYTPSSSGGGDSSYWENPYDELYNLNEQINESIRTREQLERRYAKLLATESSTLSELREGYYDQINALKAEYELQKQMEEGRLKILQNVGNELYTDEDGNRTSFNSLGVTKYGYYDYENNRIVIDFEGLEALTNSTDDAAEGEAAEAYISLLEEYAENYEDVRDELWEIEDAIEELQDSVIDSYLSLEDRVMDALVNQLQANIDNYQELSDTITEANNEILEDLQESIDLQRQIRDNTETEQEIADKEQRLAYLKRDTSGANQTEIKQLEKELEDARESYNDTLVDQAIEKLTNDNTAAEEQRNKQIEIMQAQLDWMQESGELWKEVYTLIGGAFNEDGTLNTDSELIQLLKLDEFENLSEIGKAKWWEELTEAILAAMSGVSAAEDKYNTDFNGDGQIGSNSSSSSTDIETPTEETNSDARVITDEVKQGVAAAIWKGYGWGNGDTRYARLVEVFGSGMDTEIQRLVNRGIGQNVDAATAEQYSYENMKKSKWKKYLKGGLVNFTGPAWLDGTSSNPEMVLSSKDTENFIMLKDILAKVLHSSDNNNNNSSNGGDNYFDIQIDAEIGSDYDVEQLAKKVKDEISKDSMYRNVQFINWMR